MTNFYNNFAEQLPVVKKILDQFDAVKKEILDFIATGKAFKLVDPYKYTDPTTGKVSDKLYVNSWSTFGIARFDWTKINDSDHHGLKDEKLNRLIKVIQRQCKITTNIIKPYEDDKTLWNGFVARITPGSKILPHRGWDNQVLRVHICLVEDPKCQITVNDETKAWKEKEVLAFVDSDLHSVEHNGTHDRIIMSFDIPFEYVEQCCPGFITTRNAV